MKTSRCRSAILIAAASALPLLTACVRDCAGRPRLTLSEGLTAIICVLIGGYVLKIVAAHLPIEEKLFGDAFDFLTPKGESINDRAIRERVARDRHEMPAEQLAFVKAVAAAAGYVEGGEGMNPDLGYAVRSQMRRLSGGSPALESELMSIFDAHRGDWYAMCSFGNDPERLSVFFSILAEIIVGDAVVSDEERSRFSEVAGHFGYSAEEAIGMLRDSARFRRFWDSGSGNGRGADGAGSSYEDALKALGVTDEMSDRDLKKAYMRLAQRYHPDKVRNRGYSEDVIKMYQRKFEIVTDAWNRVREKRGI